MRSCNISSFFVNKSEFCINVSDYWTLSDKYFYATLIKHELTYECEEGDGVERLQALFRTLGWHESEVEIETQPMGATNASYRCRYHGERYVVRLGSSCPGLLAINRKAEEAALKVVSENGCGASLVYYDADTGNMVTRYLAGRDMNRDDFRDAGLLQEAVRLMRQLHALQTPYSFDMYRDVEEKLAAIRERGIPLHAEFSEAYQFYREIAEKYPLETSTFRGLCHGDMFANNFLLTEKGQIVLLDYEYAGMSDIFYDLACFSTGWNPEEKAHLLQLYFGESRPELLQKLCDFSVVSWMWNGTWAYLKSCEVPPEQFDYIDFGHKHIDAILNYKRAHPVR